MTTATVYLVPHTHWDREWYEPFQRFRLRLVDLLDDVIARAEADPSFRFTLDGQLAAVDDYLEVRPEAEGRVRRLVRNGQFAVGPWAILLDEFLCSGENIARNLEWGMRRAEELGGVMPVGYLPDMFGHIAQMPQILAAAGLTQACVWRGVPSAVTSHAFAWEAPDGTAIRTEYLPGGYGNAAEMLSDPNRLGEAVDEHVSRMGPWGPEGAVLAMYGTDHSAPLPWLASAVTGLGEPDRLRLATLTEYLSLFEPASPDGLPRWRGELRSHARANILPGVLSNRPHLKHALSTAERMVERYAEPFAALWTAPERWPSRLLELAWQRLVQSSCHDSVTGCGVDETAVQVAARIAEAEQIGRGVRDRALTDLADRVPADAIVVVNPSPRARTGLVRAAVPHAGPGLPVLRQPDGSIAPTQLIAGPRAEPLHTAGRPAGELAIALRKASLGLDFLARAVQRVAITGAHELTVTMGRTGPGFTAEHRALSDTIAETGGDWTVRVMEEPRYEVYALLTAPPLGWSTAVAAEGPTAGPVTVSDRRLGNGLLTVSVAADGTLDLVPSRGPSVSGVGRLVDGGDVGDLYNYAPPPNDVLVDAPSEVDVAVVESGPLLAALDVRRQYPWATVVTRVELRAGEPFCRLEIAFANAHHDHRVRFHAPLPAPADRSYAEGQFAVVERGLTSEGGHGEAPLPTFPAYGFVAAGGVALLLDRVSEYELVGGGTELALTLLRATGWISRPDHPLRAEPAGPVIATPEAQCVGQITTRLAVMPYSGTWLSGGVAEAAEDYRLPLISVPGSGPAGATSAGDAAVNNGGAGAAGGGSRPAGEPAAAGDSGDGTSGGSTRPALCQQSGISVEGATMTSLRRRGEWLELRLVALTDEPTTATIAPLTAARRADLRGRPGDNLPVDNRSLHVDLRPWEVATLQIRPARSG